MKNVICAAVIIFSLVMMPIPAGSQVASGPGFTLEQAVIAGGGGQGSTGSSGGTTFTVDGTIGQAVAGGASSGTSTAGTFAVTSGFWNFTPEVAAPTVEADVAARPNGDGSIQSNDVVQVRRFLNEIDTPSTVPNEFQRGDSAPRASQGNGMIDSADVIQTIRYLNEVDALQLAGGPIDPVSPLNVEPPAASVGSDDRASIAKAETSPSVRMVAPELRVESRNGNAGQMVTVNIRTDALGTESNYAFGLDFNLSLLSYASFSAGTTGGQPSCNLSGTTPGRVRCSVGNFPVNNPLSSEPSIGEIPAGNNQLLVGVTFLIAQGAAPGLTSLNLAGVSVSDDATNLITMTRTNGTLTILAPTAASVSVSGRLVTAEGSGVTNAIVSLADSGGSTRTALTTSFGYFSFESVAVGQTYMLSVSSKRYRFNSQVVTVVDEVTGLIFIAEP